MGNARIGFPVANTKLPKYFLLNWIVANHCRVVGGDPLGGEPSSETGTYRILDKKPFTLQAYRLQFAPQGGEWGGVGPYTLPVNLTDLELRGQSDSLAALVALLMAEPLQDDGPIILFTGNVVFDGEHLTKPRLLPVAARTCDGKQLRYRKQLQDKWKATQLAARSGNGCALVLHMDDFRLFVETVPKAEYRPGTIADLRHLEEYPDQILVVSLPSDGVEELVRTLAGEEAVEYLRPPSNPFVARMRELLAHGLVGRREEVKRIIEWAASCPQGYGLLKGDAGVGKSTLVAALGAAVTPALSGALDEATRLELDDLVATARLDVVPCLIRRGALGAPSTEFLRILLRELAKRFKATGISAKDVDCVIDQQLLVGKLAESLPHAAAEARLAKRKLLLLIDGIDEAVSGQDLLSCLPEPLPEGVLVLLSGRQMRIPERFKLTFELDLPGLTAEGTQALLVKAEPAIASHPEYVAKVHAHSKGAAQYITLLARELQEKRLGLEDDLPNDPNGFYRDIEERLVRDDGSGQVPRLLRLLALAQEPLTLAQITGVLGLSDKAAARIIDHCLEVIDESHPAKGQPEYGLGEHETLRGYLRGSSRFGGRSLEVGRDVLRYAVTQSRHSSPSTDVEGLIQRTLVPSPEGALEENDADRFSEELLEGVETMSLTVRSLLADALARCAAVPKLRFLGALAGRDHPATSHFVTECLVNAAEDCPDLVGKAVLALVSRDGSGPGALAGVRVALGVAAATRQVRGMEGHCRQILLAACRSSDRSVRSLAMVVVAQVALSPDGLTPLGRGLLAELARRALWCGLPIPPRRLEPFVGCSMSLLFERPHDPKLLRELKEAGSGVVSRLRWIAFGLRLFPRVALKLWSSVSQDFNSINPSELKVHKRFLAEHPERAEAVHRMIDFIDPAHAGDFAAEVEQFDRMFSDPREPSAGLLAAQGALICRALHDESNLEELYKSWQRLPPHSNARQDFMYRLRVVQVGRTLQGAARIPADPWNERMRTAIREFLVNDEGTYLGTEGREYPGGAAITGIVFLAHQEDTELHSLLIDLVDGAIEELRARRGETTDVRFRRLEILLKVLEAVGVEYGSADPLAREVAFHGISRLVWHSDRVRGEEEAGERFWNPLASIVFRMRFYQPEAVAAFVATLDAASRTRLHALMSHMVPNEGIGVMLSQLRLERLFATVLTEPKGRSGLRGHWQEFLAVFLGPTPLAQVLSYAGRKLLELLRSSPSSPPA